MATELPDRQLPGGVADEVVRELQGEAPRATTVVPPRTAGERIRRIVVYVLLVTVAILYFTPFLWSVSTSLKTLPESVAGFDLLPDNPTLDAYRNALTRVQLRPLRREQRHPGRERDALQPRAGVDRRLRVRAPALPGPRAALHGSCWPR